MHCHSYIAVRTILVPLLITLLVGASITYAELHEESLQDIELKLQQAPDSVDLLLAQGAILRQQKDYATAAAVYEHILKVAPEDERARNLLVMVLHCSALQADSTAALPLLRRAVELAPQAAFLRPDYLTALISNGRTSELVAAYEALPTGEPITAPILAAVANAYRKAERYPAAATLYRAVLEEAPADADAGLGLALTLLDDAQYPAAREAIETTLTLYPMRPTLLLALAAIQWKSEARVLALDTFDRILEIDPLNGDAVNLKAQLLTDMGCASLALGVIEKYPALMWPHVRHYVETRMAEARTDWNEDALTNRASGVEPDQLLALCYYDVTDLTVASPTTTTATHLLQQIEYLRTHGYHFVSAAEVAAARSGKRALPENGVLLSFDHGYAALVQHVLPILELYHIPAIVSLCPAWIEHGAPVDLGAPLMSWEQVSRLAGHRLITLGLEAEGLFELVCSNPQGDTGYAALTRIYDGATGRYEDETAQRERIQATLSNALRLMSTRVGSRPRVLVWSHGARSALATAEAERLGFLLQLGLSQPPHLTDSEALERIPVLNDPSIGSFIALAKPVVRAAPPLRGVAVSLDRLDAPTPRQLRLNIDRLVTRLRLLGANTAIVSACADSDADGNTEAAYFPTGLMRVKHDILDHVAARLQAEGFRVFMRMPVLSIGRPADARNDSTRVMEARTAGVRPSFAMQKRYSPFSPEVGDWVTRLYRDLAAHVRCDGIVFGEDAYLTDSEDFNPAAKKVYMARLGTETPSNDSLRPNEAQAWTELKTEALNRLIQRLGREVQLYRPDCLLARTLFAPALHYPESERWLAQNYSDALSRYNYVLLMAYAEMEDVSRPEAWLSKLVELADMQPNGLEKTIFKLQAMDWEKHRPIKADTLDSRLKHLAQAGALHLAYGPDDPIEDEPRQKKLKAALATPTQPRK
ncbi:MAG: poly-beta-1,6-N-acetyl-D-glucosamine N-deacetylase PgaB [Lentisphaerae bacterium]|nr:poly-beta-1,6-N-acetyl-D-glucosamine N-deacetylase PgaB [Lentisphaerota bacterium]